MRFLPIALLFISGHLFSGELLSSDSPADSVGWEVRLDKDGILVESRLSPGASYREFRAEVQVEASLAQAIALLKDTSACTMWLFRCEESRVLREISTTERIFYQVTSLPFPAKSRDAIFHAAITFEDEGSVHITMTSTPDELPPAKHIRVREAVGTYLLVPGEDGRLRIIWQQYIDPAGALPAWLVNSMLTDLPYKSLQSFRKLVRQPPYSSATMIVDPDGNPIDIRFTDSKD